MVTASHQFYRSDANGIIHKTCKLRLPMAVEDGIGLPEITLAVRGVDGTIAALALGEFDVRRHGHVTAPNQCLPAYVPGRHLNHRSAPM